MQEAKGQALLEWYAREYMRSVYYYCLKKTGEPLEAEELAADITAAVADRLYRGDTPQSFGAWVWKIARNRWVQWVKLRVKNRERTVVSDTEPVAEQNIERDAEHREQLSLLRSELAFMARDYRDIVVAFYIEDRRVSDIAKALSLPEGTVKRKLFEARAHLKEGMNMSREFGVRSYKPENVRFLWATNLPQSQHITDLVKRKIPKNLLLEASENPSSAEELALALGVSLPYIEEEIAILEEAGFLRRESGKYITNFFVADTAIQRQVYKIIEGQFDARYELAVQAAKALLPELRCLAYVPEGRSDRELMWFLLINVVNGVAQDAFDDIHADARCAVL